MTATVQLLCAIAVSYVAAVLLLFMARQSAMIRVAGFVTTFAVVVASPLFISPSIPWMRFLAGMNAVVLGVKMVVLLRRPKCARAVSLKSYWLSLFNVFYLYFPHCSDVPPPRPVALRNRAIFIRQVVTVLGAATLFIAIFSVQWQLYPFVVEHTAKLAVFLFLSVAGMQMGAYSWSAVGAPSMLFSDRVLASKNPVEFWQRWNLPAQQFYRHDVFLPLGGRARPITAMLATFAVNGLVHEYVFGIPTGRPTGLQLVFFLIQGCAVALAWRMKLNDRKSIASALVFWIFMLVSTILFFYSANQVFPIYAPRG